MTDILPHRYIHICVHICKVCKMNLLNSLYNNSLARALNFR